MPRWCWDEEEPLFGDVESPVGGVAIAGCSALIALVALAVIGPALV
ncbi:hypothetical protein G6038_17360 [Rhodococcus sp. 14C212]|nr:hypothetical protein [Rhodococcus sp. 14C212]NGP07216.1 hypothetical protein [Rhodococcus sp. 14C212]